MRYARLTLESSRAWRALALGIGLGFGLLAVPNAAVAQSDGAYKVDPALVKGPNACGECHKLSLTAWKQTQHAKTFKQLPRRDKSKEIIKNLGLKRIKSASDCLSCHFTSADVGGKIKPIAGIACESCHGGGKNWIVGHGDYGGKDVTRETETADHRQERNAKSEAAGMIRPARLYAVVANCYGCHTVPNERLVNVGGHPAGSKFELVSWSQGEVRHNVWYTKENDEASAERKRMMFIVGKALDLEYALRGVAKATEKATYAVRMAKRAAAAKKVMKKIASVVSAPELDEIVAIAATAKLKLNNEAKLTAAAEAIATAAKAFDDNYDGSTFGAVDALIPAPDKYKGQPPS
jgi:hypothetical protein